MKGKKKKESTNKCQKIQTFSRETHTPLFSHFLSFSPFSLTPSLSPSLPVSAPLTCQAYSTAASTHAPVSSDPVAADHPIIGGKAPTTAPTHCMVCWVRVRVCLYYCEIEEMFLLFCYLSFLLNVFHPQSFIHSFIYSLTRSLTHSPCWRWTRASLECKYQNTR